MAKIVYTTKEEAMQNISKTNSKAAAKQTEMINDMYGVGLTVSQNDLDNIEHDYHKDAMRQAMSY